MLTIGVFRSSTETHTAPTLLSSKKWIFGYCEFRSCRRFVLVSHWSLFHQVRAWYGHDTLIKITLRVSTKQSTWFRVFTSTGTMRPSSLLHSSTCPVVTTWVVTQIRSKEYGRGSASSYGIGAALPASRCARVTTVFIKYEYNLVNGARRHHAAGFQIQVFFGKTLL